MLEFKRNEDNKYRTFEESDISMLLRIKTLRNRGFTLEQIKNIFLHGSDESAIDQYKKMLDECDDHMYRLNLEKARLRDDIDRIEDRSDRYVIRPAMYAIVYLNMERVILDADLRQSLGKWLEEVPMARTFFRLYIDRNESVMELGLSVYPGEIKSKELINLPGVDYIPEYPCIRKRITISSDRKDEASLRSKVIDMIAGESGTNEAIYGYLLTSKHCGDQSEFTYEVLIPII